MLWVFSLYFELKISPFLLVVKIPTLTITQPLNPTFFWDPLNVSSIWRTLKNLWIWLCLYSILNFSNLLRKLRRLLTTKDVALRWQSVHTGIAIVCNRLTCSHRDRKGRPEWYDSLVNYSGSGRKPWLLINDLGMDLEYSSGTMVGFCGMIFKHEVKSWSSGDRVCYAHFMK